MNSNSSDNRTVLITGAGRRIGRALALDFAAQGWQVGVHYLSSRGPADDLVREIEDGGGVAASLGADLADLTQVEALVGDCARALGVPSCLVNNASTFTQDDVGTLTGEGWGRQLDVNLRAPIFLAQSFAARLPGDENGNIINLIDQRVWKPTPLFYSYMISKSALLTATKTLAQALAPRIRVNAIGPGPVLKSVHQTTAQFERQSAATLLGHGTAPGEIARAIRFILDAPAMTGQMIALDGGQHLAWRTSDVIDVE